MQLRVVEIPSIRAPIRKMTADGENPTNLTHHAARDEYPVRRPKLPKGNTER